MPQPVRNPGRHGGRDFRGLVDADEVGLSGEARPEIVENDSYSIAFRRERLYILDVAFVAFVASTTVALVADIVKQRIMEERHGSNGTY